MITFRSEAQTPSGYTQPTSVSICNSNGPFSVNLIDPPAGGWPSIITLSLEAFVIQTPGQTLPPTYSILNPWQSFPDCYSGVSGNNPIRLQNPQIGDPILFTINSYIYNPLTKCYDFVIAVNPSGVHFRIEALSYDLLLDCSVQNGLNSTGILIQRWFYNTAPTFLNIPAPTPIPLNLINLVQLPIGPQIINLSGPFNSSQDWDFSYRNASSNPISIKITHFETTPCSSYILDGVAPIRWEVNNSLSPINPISVYSPFTTISIPAGDYLHIRQKVKITGCILDCNNTSPATTPTVNFRWKCSNIATPPTLCSSCQEDYSRQLMFSDGVSSYKITRLVEPTDPVALQNTQCQGETTLWTIEVTNTGTNDLPTIKVDFENLFPNTFSLANYTSITVDDFASCSGTCHSKDPLDQYPGYPLGTCGLPADFNDFTDAFSLSISDLPVGETSTISFHVKNFVSDDGITFFNTAKYYNQWRIQSECSTKCGNLINPDYTNSAVGINNGISGYSTSNSAPSNDVNLASNFSGNPLNTTVYPPAFPPSPPYFATSPKYYKMCFSNIFGNIDDQQAFGFSANASTDISGFLKLEIDLVDQGLSIVNPMDISFAFPGSSPTQIFPIYAEGLTNPFQNYNLTPTGGVHFVNNNVPVAEFPALFVNDNCINRVCTLYYRLSDLDVILPPGMSRKDLFKLGCLILGFTPCCSSGPQPSDYTIKLSALPNESCFSFSSNTFTPTGTAQLCWLPLQETTGFTYVHCPGCVAPGIIIDDYTINRTSLGYPDITNDGLADNTTPITYYSGANAQNSLLNTYLPEYNNLELEYSTYGDEMEDYLIAHFEDGDNTNGGYTYDDMKIDQAFLDVIQLYRIFQNSGVNQYDVQITGFDFYIDDPSWTGGTFVSDFNDFPGSIQANPSLLKLSVFANDLINYVIRGTLPNDDKMLFTFSEAMLQNPLSPGTKTFFNGAMSADIDFKKNQQYRLRVRYKVCGNPAPSTIGEADDGEVSDIMYLTGLARTSVPVTLDKMPETANLVCSPPLNLCISNVTTPCSPCNPGNVITQSNFADQFLFYCEGNGAKHHFVSTILKNTADYYLVNSSSDDQCRAAIDIKSSAYFSMKTNNNPNNFFRYEYKAPKLFQTNFLINEPCADWTWNLDASNNVDITLNSYNCEGYVTTCGGSSPIQITNVAPATTLNFNLQNIIFDCLTSNTPIGAFIADEVSAQRIQIKLKPIDCTFASPACSAATTDCKITFSNNAEQCSQSTNGCSFSIIQEENSGAADKFRTIQPPNPNITAAYSPPNYSSGNGTVTWDFWVWNNPSISNQFITAVKNVYLALNPFPAFLDASTIQVTYDLFNSLNNLQLSGPYTANLSDNHYLWLTPTVGGGLNQLNPDQYFHGQITVDLANCNINPSTFPFLYGWSCYKQIDPPTALNLCFYKNDKSVSLNIEQGLLSANGSSFSPTGYTACSVDPIIATANFQNNSNSVLTLQTPSLVIPSGSIVQANLIGFDLNCTGTFNTNMNSLPTSMLIPGECLKIQVAITTNGCHTGPLEMPKVIIPVSDFCGPVSPDCSNDLLYLPSSGTSNCYNCYSITKTVTPTSAQPGDPVTFTITINSNNSLATVITLNETLPPFFNMVPPLTFPMSLTLNPVSTTNIPVTGIFIDEGECVDLINIAEIDHTGQSATACVDVECEFPLPGDKVIEVFDDENISLFTSGQVINDYIIHVYDYKTLTIDITSVFNNCTFIMGTGSSIIVPDQQTSLYLQNNTRFYSCPRMWQGIRVMAGANIIMNNTTLKDADKGVFLEPSSHFEIANSFFYDCVVGVYSPSNNGVMSNTWGTITGTVFGLNAFALKGNYSNINIPITQDAFGKVGRAGILLNDINLTIGDNAQPENIFFNINYGIEIHNSNVDVYNCAFRDIIYDQFYYPAKPHVAGAAIFAVATEPSYTLNVFPLVGVTNQTIDNAPIGIYNERYNTMVWRLNMDQVFRGVWSERNELCAVQVSHCNINSTFAGIHWLNNDRALLMRANNNIIKTSHPSGFCIYAAEYLDGNDANYQIIDNYDLQTISAKSGIYLNGVENALVGYNIIYTNGSPVNGSIGIGLEAGRLNNVYCNTVMGNSNANVIGLKSSLSTDNIINCNHFNTSYRGVYFKGPCTGTDFKGNYMSNNFEGLYLDGSAIIGSQSHRGNYWAGNFSSGYGANNVNITPFGLVLSKFEVSSVMGTTLHPIVPSYNIAPPAGTAPINWFENLPGSTFGCGTSNVCIASLDDDDENAVERAIATDSLVSMEFDPESRIMARAYLFDKLMQSDTLLFSDSVFTAFYTNELVTTTGQLYSVKEKYFEIKFNPYFTSLLLSLDSLLKIKGDSVMLLDSLAMDSSYSVNLVQREDLINSMNLLRATLKNIQIQKNIYETGKRDSMAIFNDVILATEIPDINQQTGTQLILLYQEYGIDTLQYFLNDILAIASQCPNSGGPSVYKMRALARELDNNIYFDDILTCLQQGYYRTGNVNAISKLLQEIQLVPNPARDLVEVILRNIGVVSCNLTILDQLGKTVLSQTLNCENNRHLIDVSSLIQGIYHVRMEVQGQNFTKKLVIIR